MKTHAELSKQPKRQDGFVSIVVAALLMVILALITLGFARIMQREQRQAIDRHLSREALYAAESGINDVAAKVADPAPDPVYDLRAKTTCDVNGLGAAGNGNLSPDGAVAYTCALYDRTPSTLEYTTSGDSKITELATESGNNLDTLTFTWGNSDTDPNNNLVSNLPTCGFNAQDLPPSRTNAPPVLKIDLTKIGARYVRDDMIRDTEYLYLLPCNGGSGATNIAFNPTATARGRVVQVRCTGSGLRPCSFTVDSMAAFNSSKYFLRLKPVYTGATITVVGTEQGGGPAAFNNAQVSIDMTAKAGDVIRRLRASLPIANVTDSLGIPEAVLQGFDGICKQIEVLDSKAPSDVRDYCIDALTPPPPPPPPPPPAIPQGDGYSLSVVGTKIYNLFHHRQGLVVLCHDFGLADCGYSLDNAYLTGNHSNMATFNNRLYFSARVLAGGAPSDIGIGCYDPGSQTFCGYAALGTTNFVSPAPAGPVNDYNAGVDNIALINSKLYTIGVDNSGNLRIYCADPSGGTPVACSGFSPYDIGLDVSPRTVLNISAGFSVVGQRLLYNIEPTGSNIVFVDCFDTQTQNRCSGWSGPVNSGAYNYTSMLIGNKLCVLDNAVPSATFDVRCFSVADGSSVAPPPNFMTQPKPNTITPITAGWVNWDVTRDGTRLYIGGDSLYGLAAESAIYCYDTATQNICAGWGTGNGWSNGSEVGNSFSLNLHYNVTRIGSCFYGIGDQPNPQIYRLSPVNAAPCS